MTFLVWQLAGVAHSFTVRVAVSGSVVAVGTTAWSPRPLLIGLVLMAVVMLALDARIDPRWLVPAMWVWVYAHGSFPLATVVFAAVVAGRQSSRRVRAYARRSGEALGANTESRKPSAHSSTA